ncbi:MAG: HAD family phosphatase [Candidatus Bathyarchaeota archaeon]|nr:HAD family phosphatase [Candidatus Termiticorpusculum sp.]
MINAVIFDWDATLANTQDIIVTSFQQTLKEVNINISNTHIERCIGIGTAETFREILRETKKPIDEILIKQLVKSKIQKQINLKDQVQLFPDTINILEMLHDKTKIGLASMNNKPVIDTIIKTKKLKKYFQAIVTSETVKHSKPHPEIFLKCAKQLDTSPSECIVVEDSLFGVKAAKAAGMFCIAVTTGVYNKEELTQEKPDIIVSNLEQAKFYLLNNLNLGTSNKSH